MAVSQAMTRCSITAKQICGAFNILQSQFLVRFPGFKHSVLTIPQTLFEQQSYRTANILFSVFDVLVKWSVTYYLGDRKSAKYKVISFLWQDEWNGIHVLFFYVEPVLTCLLSVVSLFVYLGLSMESTGLRCSVRMGSLQRGDIKKSPTFIIWGKWQQAFSLACIYNISHLV